VCIIDQHIIAFITFFHIGHETTSSALSWAIYELAMNQSYQESMIKQIDQVVGDKVPLFDDFDKLPLLNNFISENMRMNPPAFQIGSRIAVTDLEYNGQIISKGSSLGINIYNIHHHHDHWKDPFTFNPERFSPENMKGHHKFSYLPFSLGPRMCLGNNFSLIEQRLFLTRLLQKFYVLPPENHTLNAKYSGIGVGGPTCVWVKLKPRK